LQVREDRQQLEISRSRRKPATATCRPWQTVQAQFVDDPGGPVASADGLIQSVMADRGYPVEDFEQRAADIWVDHP
jgi:hypothetical protein